MTCFWDNLMRGMYRQKLIDRVPSIPDFIGMLKKDNMRTTGILHNGMALHPRFIEENFTLMIPSLNERAVGQGYDCSGCDPVMLLICKLYNVNIIHTYRGHVIKYTNPTATNELRFSASAGHFSLG